MNILNIALKEFKTIFRDVRTFSFMLAFPIVLMLVLGTALSSAFDKKISVDDIRVLYKDNSTGMASESFQQFAGAMKKEGIEFKKIKSGMDGKKEVKQGNYEGYVELNDNGITLYENDRASIEGSMISGALSSYAGKYNAAAEISKVDPSGISTVMAPSKDDYIKESSLKSDRQVGSMDYYAIAMTSMIAMYSAISASTLIRGERVRNTADRLLASPVSKGEIFLGKLLGCIAVNGICILAVMAFSKYVFKANWGDHLGLVILILLSQVVFAISLGLGCSFLMKTGASTRSFLTLFIQLSSFFGGAYFVIEGDGFLHFLLELSPITWVREGLNRAIYMNQFDGAYHAMMLNFGLAAVLLLLTVTAMRRKERL
ncbi:ABC transporter permease [Falsibacillus pallidus]|uniref:ABC-2 type transport system permease protein n=1 Tax=Falsibacillus pallidus TaxID=493781 RepID=A0A370GB41_9BACI|nr:ABC transporter permease [Falsibacillus pallidus]RDI41015.1 ABC-2 type transport system permease protein [Falsibacillus pallidus]